MVVDRQPGTEPEGPHGLGLLLGSYMSLKPRIGGHLRATAEVATPLILYGRCRNQTVKLGLFFLILGLFTPKGLADQKTRPEPSRIFHTAISAAPGSTRRRSPLDLDGFEICYPPPTGLASDRWDSSGGTPLLEHNNDRERNGGHERWLWWRLAWLKGRRVLVIGVLEEVVRWPSGMDDGRVLDGGFRVKPCVLEKMVMMKAMGDGISQMD
ncbi:hypothetical protein V6N12_058411 [Hibiscus sabdariffa]|uniref:Uncharacterized protein n=1 Tax=Hibiscus sabdariffa TaxID=183260 RepID=A0ABR2EU09_9ROSI